MSPPCEINGARLSAGLDLVISIAPIERDYIIGNLRAEHEQIAKGPGIKHTSFLQVMGVSAMWKLIIINFFYQSAIYVFVIWLPTVIKNLTQANIANVGFLSALPYIGTMLGMYAIISVVITTTLPNNSQSDIRKQI